MTANREPREGARDGYRIVKSNARGHQRGGSDHSAAVRLGNGAVHARRKAKIIGVNDESAQATV